MSIKNLTIDQISEMSAAKYLWEATKDGMDDVIIEYSADLNVSSLEKKSPTRKITVKDFWKNVQKTYNALKNMGLKEGDVLSYASVTTPEFIYTMYACFLSGILFAPIDVRYSLDEIKEHIEDIGIHFENQWIVLPNFICNQLVETGTHLNVSKTISVNFQESLPFMVKTGAKLMSIVKREERVRYPSSILSWTDMMKQYSSEEEVISRIHKKNQPISITKTTGTTGKPKMVFHTNENWNAQAVGCGDAISVEKGDKFLNITVPWVDFGTVIAIHFMLSHGVVMHLDPLWKPELNAQYLVKYKPKIWMGGPGWLDDFFTNDDYDSTRGETLKDMKYYITGGAPLFPHKQKLYQGIVDQYTDSGLVVPGYGLTEVTATASANTQKRIGSFGKILSIFEDKVVDPVTGEEVKNGEEGEYMLSAKYPHLSPLVTGYINNDEATNELFKVDSQTGKVWVKTGDKVIKMDDGFVYWQARYKHTLTYNGYNVDCDRISSMISQIEGVKTVAIVGVLTDDGNQKPLIFIEVLPEYELEKENIRLKAFDLMAVQLPEYYMAEDIVLCTIPIESMKINYNQLKRDYLDENGQFKFKDTAKLEKIIN